MGRRKKKNSNTQQQKPKEPLTLPVDAGAGFSAEEWQHIIANAIVEAEEIKARKEEEQKEKKQKEFREKLGYKEHSCILMKFLNRIWVILHLLFIPKKDIEGDRASMALIGSLLHGFWSILSIASYSFSFLFLTMIPVDIFVYNPSKFDVADYIELACVFILLFVFGCIFRIAKHEVDKISDKNFLFSLFSSVIAIVSLIVAIIAIFVGG